jgi:hypothetical protein
MFPKLVWYIGLYMTVVGSMKLTREHNIAMDKNLCPCTSVSETKTPD